MAPMARDLDWLAHGVLYLIVYSVVFGAVLGVALGIIQGVRAWRGTQRPKLVVKERPQLRLVASPDDETDQPGAAGHAASRTRPSQAPLGRVQRRGEPRTANRPHITWWQRRDGDDAA